MPLEFDSKSWTGDTKGEWDLRKLFGQKSVVRNAAYDAMNWFRTKVREAQRAQMPEISNLPSTRAKLIADEQRRKQTSAVGQMYFYVYDPKWKDDLPYYDRFPLVFPIEPYHDGFLGINLHYLDIEKRLILFSKLTETIKSNRFDANTKLHINYGLLKGMGKIYQPCLKRYLSNHVRSQFIWIEPTEWKNALYLPVEHFAKADKEFVWKESRRMMK